ncbi:MAG TPA: hypothetical protein VFE58_03410 [Tepidisphaeraceae bacterium]|jgi:flavin-dependent dehydrogenase|nr:hypothetical protein [Tepidisphaeraceae bacterium]
MAKTPAQPDVLILGEHPAAYLAGIALRTGSKPLRVVHATIPGERVRDRLVAINPEFFELHKAMEPLRKTLHLCPIYGLRFLSLEVGTASEYRDKQVMGYVGSYAEIRDAMAELAGEAGVEMVKAKTMEVHTPDEKGVEAVLGKTTVRATALVLAGELPAGDQKRLGLPEAWEAEVVHRYSFIRLAGKKFTGEDAKSLMPMSLDLNGDMCWGWFLCREDECQLAVEQPIEQVGKMTPQQLLTRWAGILQKQGVLKDVPNVTMNSIESMDLPLAGALAHEGVADRTLLVGPAGGFYSATGEDIYPNCWSAMYAAEVIRKAIKEPHLQDAINSFRHVWRTTLGEYLRGPQQNLRFLMPLVYRNPVMTERLAESILQGKSVVR